MLKPAVTLILFIVLTLLTQLGGIALLVALLFRRRVIAFCVAYASLSIMAMFAAPLAGRVPLSCFPDGPMTVQSPIYCALNRQYVTPDLRNVLLDFSTDMETRHPGTQTLVLDANFPFFDGFPLLPHLSHRDGEKVDLAFYYRNGGSYAPGTTRSPIGYFAFEDGPTQCPKRHLTLRWDMAWLQTIWRDLPLDGTRMTTALALLNADPRVTKVFIEPHLKDRFGPNLSKLRFQGCRAARHDDHIHLQL